MNPLSLLYGAVSGARNLVYNAGWFTARLQAPVVSVGNISVGGTGKTPFIIYLGEELKRRGIKFDVLSRGYRRESRGIRVVEPAGLPREFGDEPLLIARKLEVPVVIGESRYHAGLLAEQRFGSQLHLLDDGFQHRQLHRDLDIVLLADHDLNGRLLPVGRLRERVSGLARADIIVVQNENAAEKLMRFRASMHAMKRVMEIEQTPATSFVAFCGIARSEGFFGGLRAAGVKVVAERAFRDHHAYSEGDVGELLRMRAASGAAGFITTEKDQINLGGFADRLTPMSVVRLNVSVHRPQELLARVEQLLQARQPEAVKA